ncbi:MAG: hypothetical protein AABZ36_05015, partial [Nitrospirota bacterium]
KISFSIGNNLPSRSSYNFLLITIKDSSGNTVRRALAPTPAAGSSTNMGVSIVTDDQIDMLLAGMASAATDDPILVIFGLTMVRSASMTAGELTVIANVGIQGIRGSGGFVDYLTTTKGYSSATLTTFRNGIVNRLNRFSTLYKDSVDATTSSASADKRGEAAALLMTILMESGTDASINIDDILSALDSMGEVVVPLFQAQVTAGNMRSSVLAALNSSMGGAIQKANADRALEKYTQALTTLNASAAQTARYNTAATTLLNSMIAAFKTFEQLFLDPSTQPSQATITAAQTALNTTMETAFDTFIVDSASTNAEILTMRTNLAAAFGIPIGDIPANMFTFCDRQGNSINWPIPMVASTEWVSSIVSAGGSLTYTRDTLAVPALMAWLDSDDNPGNGINSTRHDFGDFDVLGVADDDADEGNGVANDEKTLPTAMASLLGLREDIEIIEFAKYTAFNTANGDGEVTMAEHKAIVTTFATRLEGRASALGGTTNGVTAISSAQKSALSTMQTSPDF